MDSLNQSRYPSGNLITENYCQGILVEESSSAEIFSNHIIDNIKANIALGGDGSSETVIQYNQIERSKCEGIFVVEGEEGLRIVENIIFNNEKGIVLLHSYGSVEANQIKENEHAGIQVLSEGTPDIVGNCIEKNRGYGIEVRNPSKPAVRDNWVRGNVYQVKLEEDGGKRWKQITKHNTIDGENEVPQGIGCSSCFSRLLRIT